MKYIFFCIIKNGSFRLQLQVTHIESYGSRILKGQGWFIFVGEAFLEAGFSSVGVNQRMWFRNMANRIFVPKKNIWKRETPHNSLQYGGEKRVWCQHLESTCQVESMENLQFWYQELILVSPRIPGSFQHPIGIVTRTHQDMDGMDRFYRCRDGCWDICIWCFPFFSHVLRKEPIFWSIAPSNTITYNYPKKIPKEN